MPTMQLSLIKEPQGREVNMSTGVSRDLMEYKCLNCKNTLTKHLTLRKSKQKFPKGGICGDIKITGFGDKNNKPILNNSIVYRLESESSNVVTFGIIKYNRYSKNHYIKWITPTWFNQILECHHYDLTVLDISILKLIWLKI